MSTLQDNSERDFIASQAVKDQGTWAMDARKLSAIVAQSVGIDWPSRPEGFEILIQRMIRARWIVVGTGICWTNVPSSSTGNPGTPLPEQSRFITHFDLRTKRGSAPLAAVRRWAGNRGMKGCDGGYIRTADGKAIVQGWASFNRHYRRTLLLDQDVLNAAAKHRGI